MAESINNIIDSTEATDATPIAPVTDTKPESKSKTSSKVKAEKSKTEEPKAEEPKAEEPKAESVVNASAKHIQLNRPIDVFSGPTSRSSWIGTVANSIYLTGKEIADFAEVKVKFAGVITTGYVNKTLIVGHNI